MQVFDTLKLLMTLLGPSWPLLGRSGPKMGPQNNPKSGPKHVQKLVQKINPKINTNLPMLGPNMDPKIAQDGEGGAQANPAGAILKALVSQMAPRWLKMAPSSPR